MNSGQNQFTPSLTTYKLHLNPTDVHNEGSFSVSAKIRGATPPQKKRKETKQNKLDLIATVKASRNTVWLPVVRPWLLGGGGGGGGGLTLNNIIAPPSHIVTGKHTHYRWSIHLVYFVNKNANEQCRCSTCIIESSNRFSTAWIAPTNENFPHLALFETVL